MAKETNSLSHLLLLPLLALASYAIERRQTCKGSGASNSTCDLLRSRSLAVDLENEEGLQLLQIKGVKKLNQSSLVEDGRSVECNHYLSGVGDEAVRATLDRRGNPESSTGTGISELSALREQRIFVAALLHESEEIMDHWTHELLRLAMSLKNTNKSANLFVSVYESGSTDRTADYLQRLENSLKFLGVPSLIVTGGVTRQKNQRIRFLADIRNRVMEPLRRSEDSYDRVLWLSDNVFCADGVLQMLAHALAEKHGGLGADAVCGMDYYWHTDRQVSPEGDRCGFYDKWVSHDIAGNNFANFKPIVRSDVNGAITPGPGNDNLEVGKPFQVFSCWNAMVVFSADIFQEEHLSFRSARTEEGECAAAEAELIFRDMWNIGRGKILVSPRAASVYHKSHWRLCAADQQPSAFDKVSPMTWQPRPEVVRCCPIRHDWDAVDFGDCYADHWRENGDYASDQGLLTGSLVPASWDGG